MTLTVFEIALGIFFVLASAAYWIFERKRAEDLVCSLLPRPKRKKVRDTWELIDAKLGAYVRGQALLIVLVAMVLSLAFWAIGLPYWLLIGAFAGLVEIIPVVGPLAAGALAVGVGLTVSWQTALAAGLAVLVVRLLEDYIVIPRVLGDAVGLTPLVVLVSVTAVRPALRRLRRHARDPARRGGRDADRRDRARQGSGRGGRADGDLLRQGSRDRLEALRQRPKMRPPRVKPRPKVPSAKAPTAIVLRPNESRFQRPSASCSSVVSGSPRRCFRQRSSGPQPEVEIVEDLRGSPGRSCYAHPVGTCIAAKSRGLSPRSMSQIPV